MNKPLQITIVDDNISITEIISDYINIAGLHSNIVAFNDSTVLSCPSKYAFSLINFSVVFFDLNNRNTSTNAANSNTNVLDRSAISRFSIFVFYQC